MSLSMDGLGLGRVPLSGSIREKFPGTYRGYTIAGAYPAQTKVPLTPTTAAGPPTAAAQAPVPVALPPPPSAGGLGGLLSGKKIYIVAGIAIVGVIIGIIYFTGKGKGRRKKLL